MHHRYYNPLLGHFLAPDFRAQGIYDSTTFSQPYTYAAGNPLIYWDPDGLQVSVNFFSDSATLEIDIDLEDWEQYATGGITTDAFVNQIYQAVLEEYQLFDRAYFVENFKHKVSAMIRESLKNPHKTAFSTGRMLYLDEVEHLTQAAYQIVPQKWRIPIIGYRFGERSSLHPPFINYMQAYLSETQHPVGQGLHESNRGYPQFQHFQNAIKMIAEEGSNYGGEVAVDRGLTKASGALFAWAPHLVNKDKPLRIALGRWENIDSFWNRLVIDKKLNHLQVKGTRWSNDLVDSLAIGDDVFSGIQGIEDIVPRTRFFLLNANVSEIYFDLNRMKTASKFRVGESPGFYAREELKILLDNPVLLQKTKFIRMGIEVNVEIDYLRRLIGYE